MHADGALTVDAVAECICPCRRSTVAIGPAEYMGGKTAHFVKNRSTGKFHRMGQREALLLQLMDGTNDLAAIGEAYGRASGKSLSPSALQGFIQKMQARGLLEANLPEETEKTPIVYRQGLLSFKLLVLDPNRLLLALQPYCGWLFHRTFWNFCLVMSVITETWIFVRFPAIWHDMTRGAGHRVLGIAVGISLFVTMAAVHEFAHALACKRYGGDVPEIGLLFRYLTIYPYTKVDDIVLFHNRAHRICVLAAGTVTSLLFMPILAVAWSLTSPPSFIHTLCGSMLVWFNFGILLNFIPFIQMDGYFILAHLVHAPDLRPDSYRYLKERALCFLGRNTTISSYPRHIRRLFAIYGTVSLILTTVVFTMLGRYEYLWLHRRIGRAAPFVAVAIILVATYQYWSVWYGRVREKWRNRTDAGYVEPGHADTN